MSAVSNRLVYLWSMLRRPPLLVWSLYVLLIPIYVVSSGLPQPGDVLIVVLVPVALVGWNGKLSRNSNESLRALTRFILWACLINVVWAAILWNWGRDLLFVAYYLYNLAIFLAALVLYQRFGENFIRITLYSVFAITLFQVLASFVYRQGDFRASLFFRNPNQLGYYALLAACIIALTQERVRFGIVKSSIGLTGCAYLALLSASRSALLGIAVLFVLVLFSNPRVIAVASVAAVLLLFAGGPVARAIDSTQERILNDRDVKRSFFEGRGYDRIWANKEYLLFGAGEGNTARFAENTSIGNLEIHSSAGTVLFSYGVVGVVIFLAFLWQMMRGVRIRTVLMLVPPLLYTIAHQGLRFTLLWLLLALFVILKEPPKPLEAKKMERSRSRHVAQGVGS